MICTHILMDEHQVILRRLVMLADTLENPMENIVTRIEGDLLFFKEYADEFHHAKEEDIYFNWMQEADPYLLSDGPVLCMNKEHVTCRTFTNGARSALELYKAGDNTQETVIKSNLYQFISYLNDHIQKEDTAIYPSAETLNEKLQNGDATMLPHFEKIAKSMDDVILAAKEFEDRVKDEMPSWLT